MLRRLTPQLPEWARPDHPILRYEMSRNQGDKRRRNQFLLILLLGILLGSGGYLYATRFLQEPAGTSLTDSIWRILFFPTLFVQIVLNIAALLLGAHSVSEERRRQTWDNLRATEVGAELTLRTRWVAVFYRLRGGILALLLVRVGLILGILYDLTAFRGDYLNMLTANIVPDVPIGVGVILLAISMTVGVLLPLTSIGLSAALGSIIAVVIKDRTYAATLQVILIALQLMIALGLLIATTQFVLGDLELNDALALLLIGSFNAFADWGLIWLQLGSAGAVWKSIPFSVLLGVGLLLFTMVQAMITDGVLGYAVRLSERRE